MPSDVFPAKVLLAQKCLAFEQIQNLIKVDSRQYYTQTINTKMAKHLSSWLSSFTVQ